MKQIPIFLLILLFVAAVWFLFNDNSGENGNEAPGEKGQTPAQKWEDWLNTQKILGCEVLSVAASQEWIEKHRSEISIPNQIEFGNPYIVSELPFVIDHNLIQIAVDPENKYRVSARKFPPDKTPLKVGDKLPDTFPLNSNFEYRGNSRSEAQKLFKNRTHTFVFEAKEIYARPDVDGSMVTYISPKGAIIHYNTDWIITEIKGSVFKRHHSF